MEIPSLLIQCESLLESKTTDLLEDRLAQVAHVDEKVVQLDLHIHQMMELRSTLLHRSNQLRSPFYVFPSEIISQIFQEVVQVITDYSDSEEKRHDVDLRRAFVLSSISRCFRQVALGTPELWRRMNFRFSESSIARRVIKKYGPIFQHCVSHTSYLPLDLSLHFSSQAAIREKENIRLITQILLAPDNTRRVKYLELYHPPQWILSTSLLSSFSMLGTLCIDSESTSDLDLGSLPLSRLSLRLPALRFITLPPSVRVLNLNGISQRLMVSILHQCPNLVKYSTGYERAFQSRCYSAPSYYPTLNHLKQLAWSSPETLQTILHLQMPSLEHLRLCDLGFRDSYPVLISLCKHISASLISLDLWGLHMFGPDCLRQLFGLSFPHLEVLKLYFQSTETLLEAIKELIFQAENENTTPGVKYLPSLRYLSLTSHCIVNHPSGWSYLLLDLLEQKRFGETSDFHLNFGLALEKDEDQFWPLEMREELRSIVHSRNLKLTRHDKRIEWLH